MLDGEAVFIYDILDNEHNIGHTENWSTDDNTKKEFDVVQELFNQVVPRNRKVGDGNYDLMDENGIFDFKAKNALALFKEHFKVDNTTNGSDFKKLVKDYSFVDSSWANQIIGKKILMGKNAGDNQINASTDGDTGLYELYENVVKVFVKKIIEEAERYAGLMGDPVPTDNWKARTGHGPAGTANPPGEHGSGMSYCYGCKDSVGGIDGFNATVTNCRAETQDVILGRETDDNKVNYRGNVNYDDDCKVGTGNGDWAGLTQSEYETYLPPFSTSYWAGIDCSGLVQRAVKNGKAVAPGLNITIPSPTGWRTSQQLFTDNSYNNVLYLANPSDPDESTKVKKKLKKGDLVRYSGHISIVHSDRASDAGHYEIIHASGSNSICYRPAPGMPAQCFFNRKVVINLINDQLTSTTLKNPTGFGRVKLWDQ